MSNITSELVTITPQIALEWLKKINIQRPLVQKDVENYLSQMRAGKWYVSNDSICFDTDGHLINGQHRLTAIIKFGRGVDILVTRGLSKEAFNIMDTGRKRRASDIVGAHGHANSTAISAIATFVIYYKRGLLAGKDHRKTVDNADVLKFVNDNPKIFDIYSMGSSITRKFKALSNKSISGLYWIFSEISKDDADKFFGAYATGLNLSKTNPIHVLREKFIEDMGSNKKYPPKDKLAFVVIAWNAFREKKDMKVIRWNSQTEDFPKPI